MANPYESGIRKNIPAVLVYLFRKVDRHGAFSTSPEARREILMIHRVSPDRPEDFHAGKWNGLGGKCELDESCAAAALREVEEESGIRLQSEQLRFAGFIQFPNFKPRKSEDWSVMVFTAEVSAEQGGRVPVRIQEGSLHWVPEEELLQLNLWPGDREFLPRVLSARPFHGTIWYREDGAVERSEWNSI